MAETTLVATAGTITISLPVSADSSNAIAINALAALTSQVSSGSLNIQGYNPNVSLSSVAATVAQSLTSTVGGSNVVTTVSATVPTAVVVQSIAATTVVATVASTVPGSTVVSTISATQGGVANLGTLSGNNTEVINTNTSGGTVAVVSSTVASTLIAGGGSNTAYVNRSSNGSVLLTGGNSYIGNSGTSSSTSTTLTGGQSLGDGRAYVDATVGSSNVTIGNNGLINVNTNSSTSANVVAQSGTVVIALSNATVPAGSSTVPAVVSISGATAALTVTSTVPGASPTISNSRLIYIQNGGNAFINPNASDVVVLAGSNTGSETVTGGTGSVTIFGGIGSFTGGRAGGNIMLTSTINGVTTLIGAGSSDSLYALAGGDVLQGGTGTEVMAGFGGFSAPGNKFITGSGSDTVLGGSAGGNTIQLGGGTAVIYGQHGSVAASSVNADTYQLYRAGGSDTISDFVSGVDVFKLSAGYAAGLSSPAAVVSSAAVSGGNLGVTLSDGTKLTFVGITSTDTTKIFS